MKNSVKIRTVIPRAGALKLKIKQLNVIRAPLVIPA